MDKKKFQKIIEEDKNKIVLAIVILLVLVGALIIYINVKDSQSYSIDPRANIYSGNEVESEIKTTYVDDYYYTPKTTTKIIYVDDTVTDTGYPISDYYYGYTYRSSDDYKERYLKRVIEFDTYHDCDYDEYNHDYYNEDFTHNENDDYISSNDYRIYYYYEYNSFTKQEERKSCYIIPPKDKLFYTKCPEF